MLKAAEFFVGGQQLVRLNEKVIGEVSKDHGINATEMGILLFLSGNPSLDTAKDIVENRMMTKSSVSRAVDSLVRQGYIRTREDAFDRRITHLVLEEKGVGAALRRGARGLDPFLLPWHAGKVLDGQDALQAQVLELARPCDRGGAARAAHCL